MSEYTPTATQVKIDFIAGNPATPVREAAGAFDRWLARHDREVREAEYARLLELAKTTPLSLEQIVRNVIAQNALADTLERDEP